jgi:hypothetical protein
MFGLWMLRMLYTTSLHWRLQPALSTVALHGTFLPHQRARLKQRKAPPKRFRFYKPVLTLSNAWLWAKRKGVTQAVPAFWAVSTVLS